eukprot:gene12167-5657_t
MNMFGKNNGFFDSTIPDSDSINKFIRLTSDDNMPHKLLLVGSKNLIDEYLKALQFETRHTPVTSEMSETMLSNENIVTGIRTEIKHELKELYIGLARFKEEFEDMFDMDNVTFESIIFLIDGNDDDIDDQLGLWRTMVNRYDNFKEGLILLGMQNAQGEAEQELKKKFDSLFPKKSVAFTEFNIELSENVNKTLVTQFIF